MLTSVGRVAVRRVQTSHLSATASASAQLLCRQHAVAAALPIRNFTVSTWSSSPTVSDKKPTKKTTTTTKKDAGATTTKSKSKATETKSKDKANAKSKAKADAEKPKKPKKAVDPEKLKNLEIKEAKAWALKDKLPQLPASSWILYTFENRGSHLGAGGITQQTTAMAEKFRQLSQSELDDLTARAAANRAKNHENYKAWVEAHEPARIYLANKFRRRLAFLTGKPEKPIADERLPARPQGSYALFISENHSRFTASSSSEVFKLLAEEWKQVSPADKARYEERTAEVSIKYRAEIEKLEARAEAIHEAGLPK
ncbi:transcription factor mitochondrial [Fusarium longipes]|uniref:Transcription factor mitochondrial n=1 Tax=Fusarium longipes TaxID=694270 RepID=A0A395RLM3_9HYPO|nr:transcription factor mitochondrial [Fusarium longipes]